MITTEEADAVARVQEQCQQILIDNLEMQQQLEFTQAFGQKLCVLVDTQAHELAAEREKVKRLAEHLRKGVKGYSMVLVQTSDQRGVRQWQKEGRALLAEMGMNNS